MCFIMSNKHICLDEHIVTMFYFSVGLKLECKVVATSI